MKTIFFTLGILFFIAFIGCEKNRSLASKTTAMRNWGAEIGFILPSSARLVAEDDGGGRDTSYGFYEWVFESPAQIELPKSKATGVIDYISLPLDSSLGLIESHLNGRKIMKPIAAFGSEWSAHGSTFRGTLVRTAQADFLIIERFTAKPKTSVLDN